MFFGLRTNVLAAALCFLSSFALLANTHVRLETPLGGMTFELYDTDKPVTVDNFLGYIESGRYENSFSHRAVRNFVLQGGGFTLDGTTLAPVPTDPPIVNEYSAGPTYSNTFGTISMARLGGSVNSATSQWFINFGNNSALDRVDEGFTVFGHIIDGVDVLNLIITVLADNDPTNWAIFDASVPLRSNFFAELPLRNNQLTTDNLFYTTWTVIPEPTTVLLLLASLATGAAFRLRKKRKVVE